MKTDDRRKKRMNKRVGEREREKEKMIKTVVTPALVSSQTPAKMFNIYDKIQWWKQKMAQYDIETYKSFYYEKKTNHLVLRR